MFSSSGISFSASPAEVPHLPLGDEQFLCPFHLQFYLYFSEHLLKPVCNAPQYFLLLLSCLEFYSLQIRALHNHVHNNNQSTLQNQTKYLKKEWHHLWKDLWMYARIDFHYGQCTAIVSTKYNPSTMETHYCATKTVKLLDTQLVLMQNQSNKPTSPQVPMLFSMPRHS